MPLTYDENGLRFLYPENWQVERQQTEEGWTVAVQSPGAAFMLISSYDERPSVHDVLETTLTALKQDYAELEAEEASERIAHHQAKGYDVDFFSLDTVNSCSLRSFRTKSATILILSQASELDDSTTSAVLDAMRQSLEVRD